MPASSQRQEDRAVIWTVGTKACVCIRIARDMIAITLFDGDALLEERTFTNVREASTYANRLLDDHKTR